MTIIQAYAVYIIILLIVIIALLVIFSWIQYDGKWEAKAELSAALSKCQRKDEEISNLNWRISQLEYNLKQTCIELSKCQQMGSLTKESKSKQVKKDHGSHLETGAPQKQAANPPSSSASDLPSTAATAVSPITENKEDSSQPRKDESEVPTNEKTPDAEAKNETLDPKEDSIKESPKESLKYASFPRSASDSIYFSDLSESIVDDSYFEIKISSDKSKATFSPLDFMKIRNYDPAMVAMLTEGVKPNVASTVLSIEPGEAHIDGKDWIIDKPAKIKLA